MFGEDSVLRSLLHLRRSSRYAVDACAATSGPYVVVRCPGGLSLLACEVEPLEALATAVMDARAALLAASEDLWRCGDEPDVLQRRYTALGLGWRDPIEEQPPGREDEHLRVQGEPPDQLSEWLSVEEASDLSGVAVTTLKNIQWRRAHDLVADKDSRHRLTFRREDVTALGPARRPGRPAA